MKNPTVFFNTIRDHLFDGHMTPPQVAGCESILDAWTDNAPASDPRFIAYSLATAFHETAKTMQPIAEFGHGHGRAYGEPVGPYHQIYFGRGLVQLTWRRNYILATTKLRARGVIDDKTDLDANADLALRPDIAADVLVFGMIEGWFSGRKLGDYFVGTRSDWVDARKIINGMDRAALVASYGLVFYHALQEAA